MKQHAWKQKLGYRTPLSLLGACVIWLPLLFLSVCKRNLCSLLVWILLLLLPCLHSGDGAHTLLGKRGGARLSTVGKVAACSTFSWWELWRGDYTTVMWWLVFLLNFLVAVLRLHWADCWRNFDSKIPSSWIPNTVSESQLRSELWALSFCRFRCSQELFMWHFRYIRLNSAAWVTGVLCRIWDGGLGCISEPARH